jgi:8-oxo-dGTP pyrophosphatase MutT (NUDIX family)
LDLLLSVRPRYASTVVLTRAADAGGFEILLTRRPEAMRFLGGYYVFPGGTVHRDDYSPSVLRRCRGLSGAQAQEILGGKHEPEEALGHWVAVIRELFEEVGVLLCVDETGASVNFSEQSDGERFEQRRRAIVRKQLQFGAFIEREDLYCDLSRAVYFDHWVTPEIYSMRFDTRFYIAELPAHQTALERSEEVTHSLWIGPQQALDRMHRRDFPILPPTTTVLSELARLSTWEHLRTKFRLP